jgi:hypothetical protein
MEKRSSLQLVWAHWTMNNSGPVAHRTGCVVGPTRGLGGLLHRTMNSASPVVHRTASNDSLQCVADVTGWHQSDPGLGEHRPGPVPPRTV